MSRHGMVDASNNNEPAHKEEVNAHYSATSTDGLQLGTASNNAPDHGADVDHEESGDRFWKSIKAWSEVTTYHGIRMVFDESTSIFRRGFWLVTTITFLIVALWFCQDQLNRYMSYKTLIEEVSMHPDTMPFPAITICSYNLVRNDSISDIRERQLLIQLFQSQKPNLTDIAEEFGTTFLNNISLRRLFENGSMTAEEYFHECYWERTISNCSEWMKTMTTSGFCYTFNAKYQTESGSAAILKVARVTGKRYGLHLILLVDPSNYFISDDDSVGYKVVIHDPWEYPDENQALSVAPGFAHYIAVTKHEHVYMPYPVLAFGDQVCVDINDVSLSLTHKNYTVQHCKHECRVQFIYDQCHCVGPLDDVHYPDCSPDALVSCYTDADSKSSY